MKHSLSNLKRIATALIFSGILTLVGCGGGGSGGTVPSIGYLIDSPVGGVTYTCGLLTGLTGSDGSFHYDAGTACSFTIGQVTVGSVSAMPSDGIVTPNDLAGVSRSDALNANAVAVAQFLQSLDDKTQSANINIPASVVAALSKITPTKILSSALTSAEIQTQLSTLVSTATNSTKVLVSPEVAATNLNTYLQANYPKLDPSAGVLPPIASASSINIPNLAVTFPATLTASGTGVGFSATSDVNANGYWEVLPVSAAIPSQWQVISGLDAGNAPASLSGSGSMVAATTASFSVAGLAYSTEYRLYFVVANATDTGKITQVFSSAITTGAMPQPPSLTTTASSPTSSSDRSAALPVTSDVTGTGYWVVLPTGAAPTAAQVIAGMDSTGAAASIKGSAQMSGGAATNITVSGLAYSTNYTLYFAATNLSDPTKISKVLPMTIQTGAPPSTNFTVSGTAATGAVFANATITITDADGKTYPAVGDSPIVTGADGSYTITLPLTAKPPFVVQAATADQTLVSVVAEAKDTTTNITPVTNLIASRLSPTGDPAMLASELVAGTASFDATKLKTAVDEIVTLIQPLMTAVGDSTNPLNGNIQAAVTAGTGADKVLDSLSITITPSSTNTVNIEVAVKQQQADGTQPTVIAFTGGTNATAPAAALPTVVASDLVPSGNAALIADLLKRMTACLALPQADRVNSGGKVAGDIVAAACKDIFLGNDAASYLSNGAIVSSTGAFKGIFATGSGAVFNQGSYDHTRGNGDLVIAYRQSDPASGSSAYNTLAVRVDTDKKLRAIGNQYKYSGGVSAYQQLRTFVNQPAASYYSTGYNFSVNNVIDPNTNKSIFAKVVVTTPKGGTLVLKPSAGYPTLQLADKTTGVATGTSFVRIRSVYADPANGSDPAKTDTTLFFASPAATDAEIVGYAAQSSWAFDYYLIGATTPDVTQHYKTRARALTIAELQTQPLSKLTDAYISYIVTNTPTSGPMLIPTPATGPISLHWTVPALALAPTSIQVWGRVTVGSTTTNWSDNASVRSTALDGDITCSATGTDKHCSGSNYATGSGYNSVHLWANDSTGREFASFYAFYTVTIVP